MGHLKRLEASRRHPRAPAAAAAAAAAGHAAVSSGGEELGASVLGAARSAGGAVPPAALRPGAGLRNRAARHPLRPEDALRHLAAVGHPGGGPAEVGTVWRFLALDRYLQCSIRAYIVATNLTTVLPPVHLDASEPWEKWAGVPRGSCDVIVAINLLQYSTFKTAQGVFNGAGQVIKENGLLVTYGAYAINGTITPPCNQLLDEELRKVNPEWGLPDVDVLRQLAYGNGMRMERMAEMEECYKCLIFRKI
ncbi:methyltransferase-like 26 B isoform X1 [Phyllopteryx taeniolatus]|uniref:methyltransferase-like 26 B isoform X1 n=1 Tax=Phyllopteryx taeniolatus TaxID=161469 RepID=UPI002AD58363|nr:methyltransferase-like 26 B isoform X1 [Phyllopteryx taeniolatus]